MARKRSKHVEQIRAIVADCLAADPSGDGLDALAVPIMVAILDRGGPGYVTRHLAAILGAFKERLDECGTETEALKTIDQVVAVLDRAVDEANAILNKSVIGWMNRN